MVRILRTPAVLLLAMVAACLVRALFLDEFLPRQISMIIRSDMSSASLALYVSRLAPCPVIALTAAVLALLRVRRLVPTVVAVAIAGTVPVIWRLLEIGVPLRAVDLGPVVVGSGLGSVVFWMLALRPDATPNHDIRNIRRVFFVLPLGFLLSLFFVCFVLLVPSPMDPFGYWMLPVVGGVVAFIQSAMPAVLLFVVASELFRWRSLLIHVAGGLALALYFTTTRESVASGLVGGDARQVLSTAVAGAAAGLIYWFIAGRSAGIGPEPPAENGDPPAAAPQTESA